MSACGHDQLVITGEDNAPVLTFIRLCDGRFFGGTTRNGEGLYYGPHCVVWLGKLLDLIGELASGKPRGTYMLQGPGGIATIGRQMSAPELAAAVGCAEQQVRDHFGALVSLAPRAEAEPEAEGHALAVGDDPGYDSARGVAPHPLWPDRDQLRWYAAATHVLLLNASEACRRHAAQVGDQAAGRHR